MKKVLLMTGLLSSVACSARAQEYYQPYQAPVPAAYQAPVAAYQAPAPIANDQVQAYQSPSYQAPSPAYASPTPGYRYANPQPIQKTKTLERAQGRVLKQFSIGMDYVVGKTSMIDKDKQIDNPLYGGDPYTAKTSNFEDSLDSLNGNVGWRPFKYFGIEAFYQQSLSDNQIKYQEHYAASNRFVQAEYDIKYSAYGLDLIGYLPLGDMIELMAVAGIANYDFNAEVKLNAYDNSSANLVSSNPLKLDDSTFAYRLGLGAQIWLSQRLAFRAVYRYVNIGGDYFEDVNEISVGVRYNF